MSETLQNFTPYLLPALLVLMVTVVILAAVILVYCKRNAQKTVESEQRTEDTLRTMEERLFSRLQQELHRSEQNEIAKLSENNLWLSQQLNDLGTRVDSIGQMQEGRLRHLSRTLDEKLELNDGRIDKMRDTLQLGLDTLRRENAEKLEQMRRTVDEKLNDTLNRRLNESFSAVSERLEQVYKGLGEMHALAGSVGDLKRVMSNVKTRGIWGEVQLGALIREMLVPSQYEENAVVVPNANERVEFAIILPGQSQGGRVYLPIDSKFPIEAYEKLLDAQ